MLAQNVYVVEDDRDVRRSVSFMLSAAKLQPRPFAGGCDFFDSLADLDPGVILLDVRMPEMDGFEVMTELAAREVEWPIVVMTGHGEVSIAVRAMKLGAIDFLEKPFGEDVLLAALERGFSMLGERMEDVTRRRTAKARIGLLSVRELQVLRGLVAGHSNKALAQRMGISLRTVEMHRANMMDRLQAAGLAEALTLAVHASILPLEEDAA